MKRVGGMGEGEEVMGGELLVAGLRRRGGRRYVRCPNSGEILISVFQIFQRSVFLDGSRMNSGVRGF
jgi:hypothetical protein